MASPRPAVLCSLLARTLAGLPWVGGTTATLLRVSLVCPQGELDRRGPLQKRQALLRVPAQLWRELQEQPLLPR